MPKMKTHSGSKKRFHKTAGGKLRGRHSNRSHILEKKTPKRKRQLGRPAEISKPDRKRVEAAARQGGSLMPRATNAVARRRRRKKVLDRAKGYYGRKHSSYRFANEQVMRSDAYAYRDRRNRKRDFRRLWVTRINAAARQGMLRQFIHAQRGGVKVNQDPVDRRGYPTGSLIGQPGRNCHGQPSPLDRATRLKFR
jgi:large subunit ribosomal protein L20